MNLKSFWRTSHLILAICSSVFLLVASITGGILAFEPVLNQTKSYHISNTDEVSIAEFISKLQKQKKTFSSVKNKNGHLIIAFDDGKFYVNSEGNRLQKTKKQKKFFKFLTKLHRSLFLKSTGRIIIGIISFLLFLITFTGILLIIKRQVGIRGFFKKIIKQNLHQYYHTNLGRFLLIPIVLISLTGTYLSMKRFKLVDVKKVKLKAPKNISEGKTILISDFDVFKNHKVSELTELNFPFSEEKDEFFHLKLKNREFLINQFSGEIIVEETYPFSKVVSILSFDLHTGNFGILWAIVLIISSFSILYFMYSGFSMSYIRLKHRLKNKFSSDESEYVILYGSENGSTKSYAKMLYEGLKKIEKKVFITSLNKYQEFPKMKQLIVLASTYGDGEAPSNASKFIRNLWSKDYNQHLFEFSVVGFGSMSYPKFCEFAKNINLALEKQEQCTRFLDLRTVNNKSFEQFSGWMSLWNNKSELSVNLDKKIINKRKRSSEFKVLNRKKHPTENTFLLELLPRKKRRYKSGDLIGIYPNETTHERLYSIAKIDNKIILSIKIHEFGVCSNFLQKIEINGSINGFLFRNRNFHFPKKAKKVVMICTGTGIAPFLGMLKNNERKISIDLYFGIQTKSSLELYNEIISDSLESGKLANLHLAFSRETDEKVYVQNLIQRDILYILEVLYNNGVIMICGSIVMQNEVFEVLNKALDRTFYNSVAYFKNRNQILVDCY